MAIDPLTDAVAANLLRIREEADLGQEELGAIARLNKNTVNRIEKGRQTLTLTTLYSLAVALKVDVEDLLKAPAGLSDPETLVGRYKKSKHFKRDKPTPDELRELEKPEIVGWLGAEADADAVHHALLAHRRRRGGAAR